MIAGKERDFKIVALVEAAERMLTNKLRELLGTRPA